MVTQAKGKKQPAQGKSGKTKTGSVPGRTKRSVPARKLTDNYLRAFKPEGTAVILPDTQVDGLSCQIGVSGVKSWVVRFTSKRDGKRKSPTIGRFGRPLNNGQATGLLNCEAARDKAREVRRDAARKLDTADQLNESISAELTRGKNGPTVAELFKLYDKQHIPTLALKSQRNYRGMYHRWIEPFFGKSCLRDITTTMVRDWIGWVMDSSLAKHPKKRANVIRLVFSCLIDWSIDCHRTEGYDVNVVHAVKMKRCAYQQRGRYLLHQEIRDLWNSDIRDGLTPLFKLQLLNGTRITETVYARWEHIDWFAKTWTLPAQHTKNGHQHTIPLSSMSMELLEELAPSKTSSGPIFPKWYHASKKRDESGSSFPDLCKVIRGFQERDDDGHYRTHDLRRTCAIELKKMKRNLDGEIIDGDVRKAVLNHRECGMTDRHYGGGADPAWFFEEHRAALEAWAHCLQTILNPPPAASSGGRSRGGLRLVG